MTDLSQFEMDDSEFDSFEWAQGREKRVPILLLLDTSSSMDHPELPEPRPIAQLNEALQRWTAVLHRDSALRYKAEIAVITFGKGGVGIQGDADAPFNPAAVFEAPTLEAGGVTPMAEAIRTGLAVLERRKKEIDAAGIPRVRPLVFLLTDGFPTDQRGHLDESWKSVAAELQAASEAKKLLMTAFGIGDASFEILEALAPGCALKIGSEDFYEFLTIVSNSAAQADPVEALRNAISSMADSSSQG